MKRWYVAQVYAGYEEAVKKDIQKRIKEKNLEEKFGEVLVPSAKLKPFFTAAKESEDQQLFPGYILVEMVAEPSTIRAVTSLPRVLRFLGGKDPIPLAKREIERVLSQVKGEIVVSSEKSEFSVGSEVDIDEGPFAGFVGIVDGVDQESEKLTVMVSIFGRMTPVELRFDQVKH